MAALESILATFPYPPSPTNTDPGRRYERRRSLLTILSGRHQQRSQPRERLVSNTSAAPLRSILELSAKHSFGLKRGEFISLLLFRAATHSIQPFQESRVPFDFIPEIIFLFQSPPLTQLSAIRLISKSIPLVKPPPLPIFFSIYSRLLW